MACSVHTGWGVMVGMEDKDEKGIPSAFQGT
jgi:hypothetical protein